MSGGHPPGSDSSGEPRDAGPDRAEQAPEAPPVEAGSPAEAGPDSTNEAQAPPESGPTDGPAAPEAGKASGPEAAGAAAEAQAAKVGDRVSGVVVRIVESDAFVDFGGRGEGVIPVDELKGEDGGLTFEPGDPIEAFIAAEAGGVPVLSRFPSGEARQSDLLYKAFRSGEPVEGTVMAVNKWGLGVSVEGLRAFCPVSLIDTSFTEDPEQFRNRTLAFKIIRFRDRGRSIVLSRRALLEAERARDAVAVRGRVAEGAELTGSVTRLESFGAFVDLGARVEGLIHVSELRHERVDHPQDVVQPGQEVKVKVIAVKHLGDRRKERISLSLKAMEKSPWAEGRERFRPGSVVTGKVEALEDFGAFVELAPNVRGLVHVSEISNRRINHPRDVISAGEEVKVAILEIDDRRKRLRLSIKRAEQMEGETNLREFEERQQQEKEETPGNATMLEALKRAQLID